MENGCIRGNKKNNVKKQDRLNGNHLEIGTCEQKKEKAQRVRNTFWVIPQKMLTGGWTFAKNDRSPAVAGGERAK